MPMYEISETALCWVTWTYKIEAESEESAFEMYKDGDHDDADSESVGNSLSWSSGVPDLKIREIKT